MTCGKQAAGQGNDKRRPEPDVTEIGRPRQHQVDPDCHYLHQRNGWCFGNDGVTQCGGQLHAILKERPQCQGESHGKGKYEGRYACSQIAPAENSNRDHDTNDLAKSATGITMRHRPE